MYRVLLVSRDSRFRDLATRFVPRIDRNIELHMANGTEGAMTALKQDGTIELVIYDNSEDNDVLGFLDMADRSRLDLPTVVVSQTQDPDVLARLVNMHIDAFIKRGDRELTEFFTDMCNLVVMTAERARTASEHRTNERRMEAMIEMAKMDQSDFQKVIDYALDKCLEVTRSEIGYVSSYDKERDILRMMAWSRSAMKTCAISNYPVEFDLKSTGIWGEPIRLGRTVTVNDYDGDNRLMKKGTPTGHVKLRRLLMVPIFINGELIGTAGVGNKPTEYTWSDEKQLKMMMEDLFEIHAKIETSKMQSFHMDLIRRFIETGPMGLIFTDSDLDVILINDVARIVIDGLEMPTHFHLDELHTTQAEDIISHINAVRKSGSPQRSRILLTVDKINMTFEVFVQMSPIDDERTGFMILFNDISDITVVDSDLARERDHIDVLEGPVLNALLDASERLGGEVGETEGMMRLRSVARFMDDYRTAGKSRSMWMKLDSVVDRASRASALGGVDLEVKTLGIEVLADTSFPLVFKHLFNNSLRHGGMVTRIDVRCRISRGNMTIVYSDDGSGIPEDVRAGIFDMAREGKFGMFLVDKIVRLSGMTIKCLPSATGALFEIDVPPENYSLE